MNRDLAPINPESYILLQFDLPPSYDRKKEAEIFRAMAHRTGLSVRAAEDAWAAHCDEIMKRHDAVIEQEKLAAVLEYGADKVMTPFEAENEITKIMRDPKHSYHNPMAVDHRHAVAYMNRAVEIKAGVKSDFGGYLSEVARQDAELREFQSGPRSSANNVSESDFYSGEKIKIDLTDGAKMPGSGNREKKSASGDVKESSAYDGRVYEREAEPEPEGDTF
ncbi:MAG: hypothetical protein A2Z83_07545 [Omnitrophica bacterium GWA2_52_8]|nr:MAG: hypothetical protein A2Z83_07545 [Omnitrophica bacterium GWA2_52_8]